MSIATEQSEPSMSDLDRGTLRNFVSGVGQLGIGPAIRRLLDGGESDEDREHLARFAATQHDYYPRTCEALARVLDGGK